jgi:NAD(P) transhydrogenase subunit alpha
MLGPLLIGIYVFVLAMFVGFEVLGKVAPTLHGALIAGLSALSGISLLGALYAARYPEGSDATTYMGGAAIVLGTVGVVAGFILTSRLLTASKRRERA